MIKVQVKIIPKPEKKTELLKALHILQISSRLEEGCSSYTVYEPAFGDNQLYIAEEWSSSAALHKHEQTADFLSLIEQLPELTKMVDLQKIPVPNSIDQSISERRSIRSFLPEPIGREQVERILHAGMCAPSAHNFQPWEFIVIDNPEHLNEISQFSPHAKPARQAPLSIVVCANTRLTEKDPLWWVQDLSACTQNMLLQARSENLGTVWLGFWPETERVAKLSDFLHLPEYIIPFAVIAIGVPAKTPIASDRFEATKIHWNSY